jgi:DNA adenine methylase
MDPPYYLEKKSNLYGTEGDLHKNFPHPQLAGLCKRLCVVPDNSNTETESKTTTNSNAHSDAMWLLCYNNCDHVRQLYADFKIVEADWSYGMSSNSKGEQHPKEILILSPALDAALSKASSQPENVAQRKRKPRSQASSATKKRKTG